MKSRERAIGLMCLQSEFVAPGPRDAWVAIILPRAVQMSIAISRERSALPLLLSAGFAAVVAPCSAFAQDLDYPARMRRGKKAALLVAAAILLAGAGVATAAVLTRTITLKSGTCAKVGKTRVCAARTKPPKTKTVRITGPTRTTVVTTTTTQTVTAPPPPPAVAFSDGTFRVGTDIQPGTYQASTGDDCFWERLSGFDGTPDEIIASAFAQTIATIEPTDAGFESASCGNWTKVG